MELEYLKWDSDFFELKIGRIILCANSDDQADLDKLLIEARKLNYDLIYFIASQDADLEATFLMKYKGQLVDKKITFVKSSLYKIDDVSNVEEYLDTHSVPSLDKLAYVSGEYSRFRIDSNFKDLTFKKLYKAWIDNSVAKKIADKIYVVKNEGEIVGMATLRVDDECGMVGLIAVDATQQGKGYGKQLLGAVQKHLNDYGVPKMEVVTQLHNKKACAFYQSCGFTVKSVNYVYHFWLKNENLKKEIN